MPASTTLRNVFTVDLEEWFHICGVSALAPPAVGSSAVARRTDDRGVLDLLDQRGVRATFFVVGWVAERHPRSDRDGPSGRPRDRIARLRARARVRSRTGRLRRRSRGQRRRARGGRRAAACVCSARLSGPSTSARCGRSTSSRSRDSGRTRAWRRSGWSATPRTRAILTSGTTSHGPIARGAAARGRSIRAGHADGMGMGTAHELAATRAARDRGREPRRPARSADRASVGDRSRSAARPAAGRPALRALLPSRRILPIGFARF